MTERNLQLNSRAKARSLGRDVTALRTLNEAALGDLKVSVRRSAALPGSKLARGGHRSEVPARGISSKEGKENEQEPAPTIHECGGEGRR
jgi:hypothetical protein